MTHGTLTATVCHVQSLSSWSSIGSGWSVLGVALSIPSHQNFSEPKCSFVERCLDKSVVIVEIKTPHTKVLGSKYRTNTYAISDELTGAIVQTLNYKTEIQRDFHRLVYETTAKFEVLEPSCIVIIGNLGNEILDNKQMRSFDLFRNTLNNFTIITYDELFEKLEMIKELKA